MIMGFKDATFPDGAQWADIARRRHEETLIGKAFVSHDFTFLDPNEQLCNYLGITKAELIGRRFTDITPEPIRTISAENARMTMDGRMNRYRMPQIFELLPELERTYVMIDVIKVHNLEGGFHCFQMEIAEITEKIYRRKVRELLKSHISSLPKTNSFLSRSLSLLRKCSVKDFKELVFVLATMTMATFLAIKEIKSKLGEYATQWWPW